MGQPVTVIESKSRRGGVVRYELNRVLTGTGHERYKPDDVIVGERPPDVLARRLFDRGGIDSIHINGSVVTLDISKGSDTAGIKELIEDLYTHYLPGAVAPDPEDPSTWG